MTSSRFWGKFVSPFPMFRLEIVYVANVKLIGLQII